LPKKVSDSEKEKIVESFLKGSSVREISKEYNFSQITINRQLKLILGVNKFDKIKELNSKQNKNASKIKSFNYDEEKTLNQGKESLDQTEETFFELVPILDGIELEKQKDLSSQPLKDSNLPQIVYMLVDKKIELIPKSLGDYPQWRFLPEEDLNRKTIEIFSDIKNAKRDCKKDEKVIKVPNPNIFNLVAPILIAKGITRIIIEDNLISL
tara:strand:- start:711 stop:1343 length:633 start_codon:yes stop_codon:yes gene_type:complete